MQGTKHRESHQYWERAIQDLVDTWKELHSKTVQALQVLRDAAGGLEYNFTLEITGCSYLACLLRSWAMFATRSRHCE